MQSFTFKTNIPVDYDADISREIDDIQIASVDSFGKVIIATNSYSDLINGDVIYFKNLQGINTEVLNGNWQIVSYDKTSFTLLNFNVNEEFVIYNGTVAVTNHFASVKANHHDYNPIHENQVVSMLINGLQMFEDYKVTNKRYMPIETFTWQDNIYQDNNQTNQTNLRLVLLVGDTLLTKTFEDTLIQFAINYKRIDISQLKEINMKDYIAIISTFKWCEKDNRLTISNTSFENGIAHFDCKSLKGVCELKLSIPFVTDLFTNYNLRLITSHEKSYPLCTIKSFPNDKVHTIIWALEHYQTKQSSIDVDKDAFFQEHFIDDIAKLLEQFPPESEIAPNMPYWSNGKHCPRIIEKQDFDNMAINNMYEWVYTFAGLRAQAYNIEPATLEFVTDYINKNETQYESTNTFICGLTLVELYKYFKHYYTYENEYRMYTIDLTRNKIEFESPKPATTINMAGIQVNSWTKFNYNQAGKTLQDLKEYYENMFKTTITMIVAGTSIVYADFSGDENLSKQLSELLQDYSNVFSLASDDESIEFPNITII